MAFGLLNAVPMFSSQIGKLIITLAVALHAGFAATLVWDPNPETDLAGYYVYSREGTNLTATKVNVGLVTRYPLPAYAPGAVVHFNVSAHNLAGLESELSETLVYTVPLTLAMNWPKSPIAGVVSYRVAHGQLNQLAQTTEVGTNLSHSLSVNRGTTIFVYVEAKNASGQVVDVYNQQVYAVPVTGSLPPLTLTRQNLAPQIVLSSPSNGASLATGLPTALTATATDSDGAVVRADFYSGTTLIGSDTSAPFSINWTPVASGTVQLSVVATDNSGASTRSAYISVNVLQPKPAAATALIATATGSSSIQLSWKDNANNESGFYVYRRPLGGAFVRVGTNAPNVVTFQNSGLQALTTYEFSVTAFNPSGESTAVPASATTWVAAPAAPSGLAGTTSSTAAALSWTDNSSNEAEFKVYRALGAGAFALIANLPPGSRSFADTGLMPQTAYKYRVTASNAGGESAAAEAGLTTLILPPSAPLNLKAVPQWTPSIRLNWTDTAGTEAGFKIYCSANGGPFIHVATLLPNTVSYMHSGLLKATIYSYRVTSFNAGGESIAATAGAKTL